MFIRVYNYNTMDKVKSFEAHTDYIRCVAVHPSLPYLLSSSDDMLIKLWDWDKGWTCTQIFEGHSHYVMQVGFNPKDSNTFASASLDRTVKVRGTVSVTQSQVKSSQVVAFSRFPLPHSTCTHSHVLTQLLTLTYTYFHDETHTSTAFFLTHTSLYITREGLICKQVLLPICTLFIVLLLPCRSGAWAPPTPTSLWRDT